MARIEFNIYKRKDGRYEGRIAVGFKSDGKVKYQSIYGHSLEEVKEKLEAFRKKSHQKNPSTELTVYSLFQEWIQAVSPRIKESTAANYQMKAEKHIFPAFGEVKCSEIGVSQVHEFIAEKLKTGLSARYVSDIVLLLKSMFKYASRIYQLYNPLTNVIMPKKKKTEVALLSPMQQNQLKSYLQKAQDRTALGIALSLYTGLRIGEVCALQWGHIDLKKQILTVKQTAQRIRTSSDSHKTKLVITEPKSTASQRTIPLPECLIDTLSKFYSSDPDAFVLSGTRHLIEPRTMQYRFASLLKRVNLPSVHFHALRHMFATNCIALGFDVKSLSEILGHSSVEITLNRYVHSSMEQKRKYMQRLSLIS